MRLTQDQLELIRGEPLLLGGGGVVQGGGWLGEPVSWCW